MAILECCGSLGVAKRIVRHDMKSRVLAPVVRIADADLERGKLRLGAGFGFLRHPVETVDAPRECRAQLFDNCLDTGLRLRRKVTFDVEPSNRFAERLIGG